MRDIDLQLFEAVGQGDNDKILTLLDAGADVKVKDKNGETAVVCAVRNIPDPELIRMIIKRSVFRMDINRLLCASKNNRNPEVRFMLKSLRNRISLFIGLAVGFAHIMTSIMREMSGWSFEGGWVLRLFDLGMFLMFFVIILMVFQYFYFKLIL